MAVYAIEITLTGSSVKTTMQPGEAAEFVSVVSATAELKGKVQASPPTKYPVIDVNRVNNQRLDYTFKTKANSRKSSIVVHVETASSTLRLVSEKSGKGKVVYKSLASGNAIPNLKSGPQNLGLVL